MATKVPWRVHQTEAGGVESPSHPWLPDKVEQIPTTILQPDVAKLIEEEEVSAEVQSLSLLPQATPKIFRFGTLLDDRLRLLVPLGVEIEQEDAFYIARCGEFNEFGYGQDPVSAVDDLRLTLAELYWTLKEEQDNLAQHLAQIWTRLREIVEER